MAKIFGILIMGIILTLMASYTVAMFGATDEGVDLTGTDYEDQYETQTEIMNVNQSMFGAASMIFMGVVVVGCAAFLVKAVH